MKRKNLTDSGQKMYNTYEINAERERSEHLRNMQRGMISNVPQKKPPVYYVVSFCMSALLIAATAWVIKWMLF